MSRALRHINPNQSVRHLFAWTLRETRIQAGFSLQGFAKRLGKSDSYLSAVELAEVRQALAYSQSNRTKRFGSCRLLLAKTWALMPW